MTDCNKTKHISTYFPNVLYVSNCSLKAENQHKDKNSQQNDVNLSTWVNVGQQQSYRCANYLIYWKLHRIESLLSMYITEWVIIHHSIEKLCKLHFRSVLLNNTTPTQDNVKIPLQRMNNCTFEQSNRTNILSISRNGWSLTPIENQLHSMTINCVLETFNNTICIETYIQLHLHTIVYSIWSIINVNWQTCV